MLGGYGKPGYVMAGTGVLVWRRGYKGVSGSSGGETGFGSGSLHKSHNYEGPSWRPRLIKLTIRPLHSYVVHIM